MKTFILSLLALVCLSGSAANAQNFPNSGFETWQNFGVYSDPQGWATGNSVGAMVGMVTVSKSTNKHSGSFAMQMETKQMIFGPDTATMPGMAFLGTDGAGIAFSGRPAALEGYFNYTPALTDSCLMIVFFSKWDAQAQLSEDIGFGSFTYGTATNGYRHFQIPIDYKDQQMPDSVKIMIFSSSGDGVPGTKLLIDDLQFSPTLGRNEAAAAATFRVYPNPARDKATLQLQEALPASAQLYLTDLLGRKTLIAAGNVQQANPNQLTLQLPDVPNGLYIVTAEANGQIAAKARLQIQR